ncbi:uncharacterized protein LOC141789274 isoform X2 [Halichoeres trimaculatus]|uniref:uncharacterized protein LOC141789274 isoform X2 n=1 Tax=Halichoeres trimaculatus TaxID=147232 RepID=UPI003D9F0803
MFFEMWLWIFTGLNVILSVHGFASGGFPQSCGSLLPQHDSYEPQKTGAPFEISFQQDNDGDTYTVSLRSTGSVSFSGFMMDAREEGETKPVGQFSSIGSNPITLLTCDQSVASAVSQANNQPKTSLEVTWTPPQNHNRNIDLRATFVRYFDVFWVNVTKRIMNESTTTAAPSTTPPTTAQRSTQPETTPLMTQSKTTPRITQPKTTQRTTQPKTTLSPQPLTRNFTEIATTMMEAESALPVLKMELPNIIMFCTINSHLFRRLERISILLCLVLSGAMEITALGLEIASDPTHAALIALVSVALILTILEIAIVSLPLGPSHELKHICDLGAKVCSVIHVTCSIAFIYIGFLDITDRHSRAPWPLWVLIAYTAWMLLFVVWIFVMTTQKHVILRSRKEVRSVSAAPKGGRKKRRIPTGVLVISCIFIVGTAAFAAALIGGIFQPPEE